MIEFMSTTNNGSMSVLSLANAVCKHLPDGWHLNLAMEQGAAYVELYDRDGNFVDLPDSADKTLEQQVNEAVCMANGFNT